MKKHTLILLTYLIAINTAINGQEKVNPLKGHYYSCGSLGYVETVFTDSLVYGIDTKVGADHSIPYTLLNDYQYLTFDTMEFYILDKHKIVVKTKDDNPYPYIDTLTRFDEKIPNWYDYNCNIGMSLTGYYKKLDDEFIARWGKYGLYCVEEKTLNDDDNEGELILPDSIEFEFLDELAKKSEVSNVMNFTYDVVEVNPNQPYKNKIKQLVYNEDKSNLKLQVDFYFPCNIHYEFFERINEDGTLNIRFIKGRWFDLECENYCQAVLSYEIELENSTINKVMLNNKELVLD